MTTQNPIDKLKKAIVSFAIDYSGVVLRFSIYLYRTMIVTKKQRENLRKKK